MTPDLLLNPHSLPGRMTIGHMIEMFVGKSASLSGVTADGTPFSTNGTDIINHYGSLLEQNGFDKFGDEWLYDGRTGRKFAAKIFTGVIYYNKLVQMVSLKIQVRGRGPMQILTHQPTEGKPRKGGLRFGEMERDALVGHGASLLLKERMLDQSDKTTIWVCKDCGDLGYHDNIKNVPICLTCGGTNLKELEISYGFKVLLDEIKSLHILPRINLKSE
jgi:DNA-directed RNA polymerase subunit B'